MSFLTSTSSLECPHGIVDFDMLAEETKWKEYY